MNRRHNHWFALWYWITLAVWVVYVFVWVPVTSANYKKHNDLEQKTWAMINSWDFKENPFIKPVHNSANENIVKENNENNKHKQQNIKQNENIAIDTKASEKTTPTTKVINIVDMSDQTMIKQLWNDEKEIDIMTKKYEESNKIEDLNILLNRLLSQYNFKEARTKTKNLGNSDIKQINPDKYLYIYFNSLAIDGSSNQDFFSKAEELKNINYISEDTYLFYSYLIDIRNWNLESANNKSNNLNQELYGNLVNSINAVQEKVSTQRDVPMYYQDSLIALELFKNWYFSISKALAIQALNQNDQYILPYQILAYSNYLTNNRESAIEYFFELIDIEPGRHNTYKFMIGTSYYWLGKYTESILHISHIKNRENQTDTYRYLLLNYQKIWDKNKSLLAIDSLLGQDDLTDTDFELFNQVVFFDDYIQWKDNNYISNYPSLIENLITICQSTAKDQNLCQMTKIWVEFMQWNLDKTWIYYDLKTISKIKEQSYLYQMMWDISASKWDINMARQEYTQAYKLATSTTEQSIIKAKLKQIIEW